MDLNYLNVDACDRDLMRMIEDRCPDAQIAEHKSAKLAQGSKKQRVFHYQAMIVYWLASQYNFRGARILEVGTYYGYTTAMLAQACPDAVIVTCGIHEWEMEVAKKNLEEFVNIEFYTTPSWDLLSSYSGADFDMIFVDGDHKKIKLDLPWWNKLCAGGLFLFHDYSPKGSIRACPPVWRGLQHFTEAVGRVPDMMVYGTGKVGMAGWYKREGDKGYDER